MTQVSLPQKESQNALSQLKLTCKLIDDCLIVTCSGPSDCEHCIQTIYQPIFNHLEDDDCTGLVIDKRNIDCSREKKSLNQVVETILRYKNRSILRKLALVSTVEYQRDEKILRDLLFSKGVNIRLFTDLEEAISWTRSYP